MHKKIFYLVTLKDGDEIEVSKQGGEMLLNDIKTTDKKDFIEIGENDTVLAGEIKKIKKIVIDIL